MIWLALFLLILAIVVGRLYKSVFRPYRMYLSYKKILTANKIKFYDQGFIPFLAGFFISTKKSLKEHGDSHYIEKRLLPEYDVILTNLGTEIITQLLNENLLKEFYARENKSYIKSESIISNYKRFIGDSLVFA